MVRKAAVAVVLVLVLQGVAVADPLADFEDLALAPESYWNGSADSSAGGFTSGSAWFNNHYVIDAFSGWAFWGGWAYSNETDTTTGDYQNQYSAITGGGQSGTTYAVAYYDTYTPTIPTITLPTEMTLSQAYVTNTTYAYLTMRDGDPNGFSKKFGGETGDDEDWFLLTITGKDAGGGVTGTVEFYLADFRFADNSQDYLVDTWTPVALSSLGPVKSVECTLNSPDSSAWGINTPTYFALDTLVPEPAVMGLLAIGAGAVLLRRRRR